MATIPRSAALKGKAPDKPHRSDTLTRLRVETSHLHTRLESRFDAVAILQKHGGRAEFLTRYWRLYQGFDAPLWLRVRDVDGLQFDRRRRASVLEAALVPFGLPVPPLLADPPLVQSRAEALGALYVLEGSTMGGRLILRQLAKLGIDRRGLDFLDPYGADSGRMWNGFLGVLERETGGNEAAITEAVRGARNGFSWAEACLCGTAEAA